LFPPHIFGEAQSASAGSTFVPRKLWGIFSTGNYASILIFKAYLRVIAVAGSGASVRRGAGLEDIPAPAIISPLCSRHREAQIAARCLADLRCHEFTMLIDLSQHRPVARNRVAAEGAP
jgi:hypothetical protein